MITEFIEDVCHELEISVPKISYDTSVLLSETMMALCDGETIYIRKKDKPDPDTLFAIAHELRHLWQIKYHENEYMSDYKDRSVLDVEEYNLQIAEIDANAYAAIVMEFMVGLKPLFNGMSAEVVAKIQARKLEILADLDT